MTQCAGTTQKGERCKREAREGSEYCAIHFAKDAPPRAERAERRPWTSDDTFKAAVGFGLLAAIVILRLRR